MKSFKSFVLFFVCTISFLSIISAIPAYATTAMYTGNGYDLKIVYNQNLCPGDPVFLVAQFNFSSSYFKKLKKSGFIDKNLDKKDCVVGKGEIIDKESGKQVRMGNLFTINSPTSQIKSQNKNSCSVSCMIPTSSFLSPNDYDLKVSFSIAGHGKKHFTLPLVCTEKEFVSEDIPLNAKNTSIKQNVSPQRMSQINKLNTVLGTADFEGYTKMQSFPSFSEPLVCNRRTSYFADRRKFIYTDGTSSTGLHYGIDYGVKTGTDVHACANGKVVLAEDRVSTGWSICIEHLPGLYSLYYHLDSMEVKVGDKVKQGERIGKSGCTGLATGPHLHWEIRLNMEAINPDWLVNEFTAVLLPEIEMFLH